MNNPIKTLLNGDFEVIPLDDPKATEFHKRRNYEYTPIDELEEYRKQAQEIWNDSCTSPRKSK